MSAKPLFCLLSVFIYSFLSLIFVHTAFSSQELRSPHCNNQADRCGQGRSFLLPQPRPAHGQGGMCWLNFPRCAACCLFDVSVLQVHWCVWLGCDPWEENLPPCGNILWNMFKVALQSLETDFSWMWEIEKSECWWIELTPTVNESIQGGDII